MRIVLAYSSFIFNIFEALHALKGFIDKKGTRPASLSEKRIIVF
jgi:hypothetical protein